MFELNKKLSARADFITLLYFVGFVIFSPNKQSFVCIASLLVVKCMGGVWDFMIKDFPNEWEIFQV